MSFIQALDVSPGVTAIIGSGGKTSLLYLLAKTCNSRAAITTTTHILPPEDIPVVSSLEELSVRDLADRKQICFGTPSIEGKLSAPEESIDALSQAFDYVFIEADGSKGLPIKAHAAHEPVIPGVKNLEVPWSKRHDMLKPQCHVIQVIGASGFFRPIEEVCHRPALFCEIAECALTDLVTPGVLAQVINRERLADMIFINQCDLLPDKFSLDEFRDYVSVPVVYGSLKEDWNKCLY